MNNDTRRSILRLARFLRRTDEIWAQHEESADLDAGFDGGEFSGPSHHRAALREIDATARRLGFADADVANAVADRFGVSVSNGYRHGFPVVLP